MQPGGFWLALQPMRLRAFRQMRSGYGGMAVSGLDADRDVLMPAEHGPRLAALYPNARLEIVNHSGTLIGEDQPERLAELIRDFVTA